MNKTNKYTWGGRWHSRGQRFQNQEFLCSYAGSQHQLDNQSDTIFGTLLHEDGDLFCRERILSLHRLWYQIFSAKSIKILWMKLLISALFMIWYIMLLHWVRQEVECPSRCSFLGIILVSKDLMLRIFLWGNVALRIHSVYWYFFYVAGIMLSLWLSNHRWPTLQSSRSNQPQCPRTWRPGKPEPFYFA